MKINKIFKVDAALLAAMTGVVVTGVGLHIAGHGAEHESWHTWAAVHVVFSLMFAIFAIMHVRQHWAWYTNLFRPSKRVRIVTILLTIAMLLEFITSTALLTFIDGEGSACGHVHWIGGLVLTALAIGHIAKRLKILLKGLHLK